jgi:hypothetical protein
MEKSIIILAILALFIIGCSQKSPDIVCNAPYMRHAESCCMDRNANSVCDADEAEKPLFVEPEYTPADDVTSGEPAYEEPVYIPAEEEPAEVRDEGVFVGQKDVVEDVPTKYQASEVKLQGWKVQNAHMSLEVTKIVIDVKDIEKTSLTAPDKEVYLKEMQLEVKNFDYNYLNPIFYLKIGDFKDPIIIKETLLCDRSDDIVMQGCSHALPEAETMYITMPIDRIIPRIDLDKTILITLENKRDDDPESILELEKSYNILSIYGAKYV